MILLSLGGIASLVLFFGPVNTSLRLFDFHSFILAGAAMMLGLSMVSFALITRVFAYNFGLLPNQPRLYKLFKYFNLETGLVVGLIIAILGFLLIIRAIVLSYTLGFDSIGFGRSIRLVFGGALSIITGGQIFLTSFALSILGVEFNRD